MSIVDGHWIHVGRTDPRAIALYRRHYSCRLSANHHLGISGPGPTMTMITLQSDALFGWRARLVDSQGPKDDGERGVMCFVFRNEGQVLSSDLVREASELAWNRWPGVRLFTYVDPEKTRRKRDPGRCFRRAGWTECGKSAAGLVILECLPVAKP